MRRFGLTQQGAFRFVAMRTRSDLGTTSMTKAKNAGRRAAEKGSGQGSVSNKDGTATGPGSSAKSRSKQDRQHAIGGQGSATAVRRDTDAAGVVLLAPESRGRTGMQCWTALVLMSIS
jgi:hypothetical protein